MRDRYTKPLSTIDNTISFCASFMLSGRLSAFGELSYGFEWGDAMQRKLEWRGADLEYYVRNTYKSSRYVMARGTWRLGWSGYAFVYQRFGQVSNVAFLIQTQGQNCIKPSSNIPEGTVRPLTRQDSLPGHHLILILFPLI